MVETIRIITKFKSQFKGKSRMNYILETKTPCQYAIKNKPCKYCNFWNQKSKNKKTLKSEIKTFKENEIGLLSGGSFLDEKQYSKKNIKKILTLINKTPAEKVIVESRPEYITKKRISEIKKIIPNKKLEIAIGLETTNDNLRAKLNKGFTKEQVIKAIKIICETKATPKFYLLYNLNKTFNKSVIKSIKEILTIEKELNCKINIGLETLFKSKIDLKEFVKILRIAKKLDLNISVALCSENFGIHPLQKYKKQIMEFNKTQNIRLLEELK